MTEEYVSEDTRWSFFWNGLNPQNKGWSLMRTFFLYLYPIKDYGDRTGGHYKIELAIRNLPPTNTYDFADSSFLLNVDSLYPKKDTLRVQVKNRTLESGLVLPQEDYGLVLATWTAFSEPGFGFTKFIPRLIFTEITQPMTETFERIKRERQQKP